jgi:hypothetical protein
MAVWMVPLLPANNRVIAHGRHVIHAGNHASMVLAGSRVFYSKHILRCGL